ncbi:hypothetical protein ACFDTO_07540 [Microbacteriaceae bacterium 4G12]
MHPGKRIWLFVTGLVVVGLVGGAITVFGWTISETHFAQPDEDFDRLTARIEDLPGVRVDEKERWVEAPTFSQPNSWIGLTVEAAGLPGLVAAACTTEYAGPVSWSFRVRSERGSVVSGHSDTAPSRVAGGSRCPALGFDAGGLLREIDSTVPGLVLQPSFWDDRFVLVTLEDELAGIAPLLPMVAHADDFRDAAGLDSNLFVEINAGNLMLIIEPGEHDRYVRLLSDLVGEHGVTSFWASDAASQTDGMAKVQIVAPDQEHAEIENRIRDSGLHIADLPIRFISQDS